MIVALDGGLGNQMFQYAFGVSVAKARGESVQFTRHRVDADPKREYGLDAFGLELDFVREEPGPVYYDPYVFDPGVYTTGAKTFIGHWQTEKYFDVPTVRKAFSPQISDQLKAWLEYNTVAVHVRRTDYLTPAALAYHGICSMEYYKQAMAYMVSDNPNSRFVVFSDDILWCKQSFPKECFFVEGHAPHEDIQIMSLSRRAIIANSSFSWWGAWLGDWNKNRIVIAPKRWYVAGPMEKDIVPERWVRIEN